MARLDRYSPFWIYMPWNNLGCLGIKLWFGQGWLYGDVVVYGNPLGHLYLRIWNRRYSGNIKRPWRLHRWR